MNRKGKYFTVMIALACSSKPKKKNSELHSQLAATIAERIKIIKQWEDSLLPVSRPGKKNIHEELLETISELMRTKRKWQQLLSPRQDLRILFQEKEAA